MARKGDQRKEQEPSEFEEKVLFINRCSKVVKGGRKFSFSALIVVGDGKGRVGYGFAKANELTVAISKAGGDAKKSLITFEQEGTTIPHEIEVRQDGARLLMKPAPEGTGIVAGSRVRSILELAGLKDVVTKSLGGNNPMNQVLATFKALKLLQNPAQIRAKRGLA